MKKGVFKKSKSQERQPEKKRDKKGLEKKRDKSVETKNRKRSDESIQDTEATSNKKEKLRKSEIREQEKLRKREEKEKEKAYLEEKYDGNLLDSDDSSDQENLLRVGNIPMKWYDLYDHKGYGVDGKQVPKMLEKDEIQKFVEKSEDPQWWRNITDELNNKEVRLSRADLEMIMRIRQGKVADKNFNLHEEHWFEYEHKEAIHPF